MTNKKNRPVVTIGAAVLLVIVAAIVVVITPTSHASEEQTLLSLIVAMVPSLIAATFAEKASRDIRNGVVAQKAKEGAKSALVETGVVPPEAAAESGPETTTENAPENRPESKA